MPRPTVQVLLDDGAGTFAYDVSRYADLKQGISINRGRQDEFGEVQPSTCSLTLDNSDGRFTFGGSPSLVNLVRNGSFESGLTYWTAIGAPTTAARSTTQSYDGVSSLRLTAASAGTVAMRSDPFAVSASTTYTVQARFRAGSTSRAVTVLTNQLDAAGAIIGAGTSYVTYGAGESSSGWLLATQTITTQANAVTMWVEVKAAGAAVGEVHYVDAVQVEPGSSVSGYTESAPPVRVDTPVKVKVTVNGVTTDRFTGYVHTWPVEWPGGSSYTEAKISATDRLARLARRKFRSVVEESVLAQNPVAYFVLGEAEGATAAGDSSGRGAAPAVPVNLGTPPVPLAFGAGTGPGTDGRPAVVFGNDASGSTVLRSTSTVPAFDPHVTGFALHVVVATTVNTRAQAFITCGTAQIISDATGHLQGYAGASSITEATTAVTDGTTRSLLLVFYPNGSNYNVYLYNHGTLVGTLTNVPLVALGTIDLGTQFAGTMSHAALISGTPSGTQAQVLADAVSNGFSGDRSDVRIARYAGWANITTHALEVGRLVTTAHQDTTGLSPAAAMQNVATTEQGLLFIDGSGLLTFHARSHRYAPTPVVSLTGGDLGADSTFSLDTQGLINSVTASRPGGATQLYEVPSSIAKYEQYPASLTLLTNTDDEALIAASWVANTRAEPTLRLSSVPVDLLTQTAAKAAAVQAIELGSAFTASGLPSQAATSSVTLFAEGWSEQIGLTGWTQTFNTSPLVTVWTLEDPVSGFIDRTFVLAY